MLPKFNERRTSQLQSGAPVKQILNVDGIRFKKERFISWLFSSYNENIKGINSHSSL